MAVPEWVKVWVAFQKAEEAENVRLRLEARTRLNDLAAAAIDAITTLDDVTVKEKRE